VPPGNADALAEALRLALHDTTTIARLRTRGPAVAAGYTWDGCVEAHAAAYRAAVHSSSSEAVA
jgi:glycosyltransferase involved in cell wall biosynthesis